MHLVKYALAVVLFRLIADRLVKKERIMQKRHWLNILMGSFSVLSFQVYAQSLDLRDAIAQTLQTNPEVQAEQREVDARDRQIREAWGGYLPSVDVTAGFGFQERDPVSQQFSNPNRTRNELERSEARLSARQMVFDGFSTSSEYKNQKSRHASSIFRARSVGEDVALEVTRAFLDVMKQEDILELAKQYPNLSCEQLFFKSSDVDQKHLVIIAANNKGLNERIKQLAQEHAFLLNAADQPEYCDFYLGGIVTKGDLKLAISTNGKAPVLAKRLRQFFEQELPDSTIELTKNLGKLRQQLKGSFSEKLQLLNQLTKNMIQE